MFLIAGVVAVAHTHVHKIYMHTHQQQTLYPLAIEHIYGTLARL
jgi:hypothetical protein